MFRLIRGVIMKRGLISSTILTLILGSLLFLAGCAGGAIVWDFLQDHLRVFLPDVVIRITALD